METKFDVEAIRKDFPILQMEIGGKPLIYLDSAASSQKPQSVIDALKAYYSRENANIHRGLHFLSEQATVSYESTRQLVVEFINASEEAEIVFVRGATEGINLVASTFGRSVKPDDEILITYMEHHSNIVPWQMLCEQTGASLKVVPVNDAGELEMEAFHKLLSEKTRLVAVSHISNALGTINPVKEIVAAAHAHGALVLVDGAQAVPHQAVDVQALDCDFYTFSGHKMFGPTGVGVLFGKKEHLDRLPPYQGGGEMIREVRFEKTKYNCPPHKFEAGTPNIAGVAGLGAAIRYIQQLGYPAIQAHENALTQYGTEALSTIPDLRLIGTAKEKAGVLSFVLGNIHAHDVGTLLNETGIAVRTGHHCAQPLMERFGVSATVRASLALYNTKQEIEALVEGLERVRRVCG